MSTTIMKPDSEETMMKWLTSSAPIPESKGKRWSDDEIAQLLAELVDLEHKSTTDIAVAHGRTRGAIESRARELAVDMVEKGVDRADIERRTRVTATQLTESIEKRASNLATQKRKKEEKARAKEEKEEAARETERAAMKTQTLSVEQQCALQQFEDDDNLFITGEGGTGKTLLIRHLVRSAKIHDKKVQVCALTGCAALLLECNARTIHSWSGIKLGRGEVNDIVDDIFQNHKARNAWKSTDTLIVDEVSMMSARIFDVLDTVGRRVRGSRLPFGGMQVIFVGDFFQLPPVAKGDSEDAEGRFCFESERWLQTFPIDNHIVLNTMFRQSDANFRRILSNVRMGEVTDTDVEDLKKCVDRPFDLAAHQGVVPAKLFPTKNKVDAINAKMFAALEGTVHEFAAIQKTDCTTMMDGSNKSLTTTVIGRCKKLLTKQKTTYELESLLNNSPCMQTLRLKRGANVMCTVNLDLERGICNGALGTVIDFSSGMEGTTGTIRPVVRFSNGVVATIPIKFWQSEEYPTVAIGQCPLSLAWAMTIHKIQGATLSMAEIDVGGGIFECGQTYVALSRVKDLEGLYLSKFDPKKIKSSVRVRNFYRSIPEVEYEVEEETEEATELGFEKFAMNTS